MLTKFDVRSSRVKGVAFHKDRPWVLCGLHNGVIQIWDYRMNTSVEMFSEHSGSVRGVDFHVSQPLFVSGADDYLIKVWNYKLRRCLYTLTGHMDYIRTTFFHREQPWILSSSDDFTVRIWNWQSRCCIACLPGHNHYVMCAQFHPREYLVVSVSLDKTIRVWDISSLLLGKQELGLAQDLLGSSDVILKFQLEGHERGVNWAEFHPTKPYIVSAADDRTVRVWRMADSSCHEEAQFRGHTNNVCCVTYFKDFIISNSEDRSIHVWDVKSRSSTLIFRRESDRYWILATLPERNLIAAGHDSGLQVFKLFRERPAYSIVDNKVLHYMYENTLYTYNFETKSDYKFNLTAHKHPPLSISCNPSDSQVAVWYNTDGGVTEVLTIPKPGYAVDSNVKRRFSVTGAVFFAPNKYAFVDKSGKLATHNLQGSKEKVLEPPFICQYVWAGPPGSLVCQNESTVYLYHVAQHTAVGEATIPGVKYVVWDKDYMKVALISKNCITVLTKRWKSITAISELTVRMKSAAFDETRDILYYTTSNHLKYCNLRNGECSAICTLGNVIYLVKAVGDTVWALTREGKVEIRQLSNVELNFKVKLQQQAYRDIIRIIQRKELKGQALVGYLHKHGYSEIALHLVTDPTTRFNLALECGAMDIAKSTAAELNDVDVWRRLASTATRFGDIQLAQLSNTKAGNFHAAGLLFLATGNMPALGHLIDTTKDENLKLHYGLFAGDVEQRIQILAKAGQLPLAYATAVSHGLRDAAQALLDKMEPEVAQRVAAMKYVEAQEPPLPVCMPENWPMLQMEESVFSRLLKEPGQFDAIAAPETDDIAAGAGWDDDEDDFGAANGDEGSDEEYMAAEGGGWEDDLDIVVPPAMHAPDGAGGTSNGGVFVVPREYPPITQHWVDTYSLPAFHVAAGSFATALDLLKRQIGLVDPTPLKKYMMHLWIAVHAAQPAWLVPSSTYAITANPPSDEMTGRHAPALPDYIPCLTESLRSGFQFFVEGRFSDALSVFQSIIHQAVLTTITDEKQKGALQEIMTVSSEYARALTVQVHLRSLEPLSKEALQLSMLFTHFNLHRQHLALALSQAMSKMYKSKNYKMAASVARRYLEQDPPKNKAQQAVAIIAEADRNPTDAVEIDYDERNPFVVCSVSHKPMYKGTVHPVRCSYCHSAAHPSNKGSICPVCSIALIGADCAGLNNHA